MPRDFLLRCELRVLQCFGIDEPMMESFFLSPSIFGAFLPSFLAFFSM